MKSSSLSSPTLSPLSQVNTDADEVQEEADPQFSMNDALQNDTGRPKAAWTCSASPLEIEMSFDFVEPIPVIILSQDYAELIGIGFNVVAVSLPCLICPKTSQYIWQT